MCYSLVLYVLSLLQFFSLSGRLCSTTISQAQLVDLVCCFDINLSFMRDGLLFDTACHESINLVNVVPLIYSMSLSNHI